jgi:hypothetical protein
MGVLVGMDVFGGGVAGRFGVDCEYKTDGGTGVPVCGEASLDQWRTKVLVQIRWRV